ncbi:MAG: hypothetical protein ACYDGL_06615 [Bellilinea sp.]
MNNRNGFTIGLAAAGTILAFIPLLAPAVFSVARYAQARRFNFDFLMPAELFPAALVGAGLLIWVATRAKLSRKWIVWSLVVAILLLVGSQTVAVVSGLATGEIEATGWPWMLVIGMLIGYTLAVASICVGAVLLLRDLFTPTGELPVSS